MPKCQCGFWYILSWVHHETWTERAALLILAPLLLSATPSDKSGSKNAVHKNVESQLDFQVKFSDNAESQSDFKVNTTCCVVVFQLVGPYLK